MSLEKPNTIDPDQDHEPVPRFETTPTPERGGHAWLWIIFVLIAAAGVFYFVHKRAAGGRTAGTSQGSGGQGGKNAGAIPVVLATAQKGDIGVYFTGLGAVTPIYTVTVKSQISVYLMQVLYQEGQIVQKGQSLAEIDPRPYQVML